MPCILGNSDLDICIDKFRCVYDILVDRLNLNKTYSQC